MIAEQAGSGAAIGFGHGRYSSRVPIGFLVSQIKRGRYVMHQVELSHVWPLARRACLSAH
jgi:hypothetical protein